MAALEAKLDRAGPLGPAGKACGIAALIAAALLIALPAAAQQGNQVSCDPIMGKPFVPVPELVTNGGVLKGTILLADQEQRIAFRQPTGFGNVPGRPGLVFRCFPQHVRTLRPGVGSVSVSATSSN